MSHHGHADHAEPTVFIVDDDAGIRQALRTLAKSVNLPVRTFDSGPAFLQDVTPSCVGCLVADVRMPLMSGLELLERMREIGYDIPAVMVTGYADVPMAVNAMKLGAVEFFEKPVRPQKLLDLVQSAIVWHAEARRERDAYDAIMACIEKLTPREREVVDLVVDGHTSRAIADQLGLSPKTVHVHRAEAMTKMKAGSVADLVRRMVSAKTYSPRKLDRFTKTT